MPYTPGSFVGDHAVLTGPIRGTVTTGDGTTYDVSAPVVEVSGELHAAEVAALIGERYAAEGHPDHGDPNSPDYHPFEFVPSAKPMDDGRGGAKMALASTTMENQALDAGTGGTTNVMAYVALHTATTGTTGTNENSGGGYARLACSWNSASAGAKTNSSALTFTTAGSTAITYIGTFSAVTAGTFGLGAALGSSVTAASITVAAGAISFSAS